MTLMAWLPRVSDAVVNVARPALALLSERLPMVVVPSRNFKVPVGVPFPGGSAVTLTMNEIT